MRRGLLATRQELAQVRNRIGRHPFDRIHDALRKRCALILESKPVLEIDWRARHSQGVWSPTLPAVRTVQGRVLDLAISHHIDPNPAYRDRAIEEMKALASWSTWTDPDHAPARADLCTAEACVAMALGLDWLEEDLNEIDRLRCLHALREKGVHAYEHALEQNDWWYGCYHNWNAVVNAGCGFGALALSDEDPRALETLHRAQQGLQRFFDALGREGGWDEGVGYWAFALRYLLLFGEALDRQLDDRSIFRQRGMDATGVFGVYFSPRGQSTSFGDAPAVPVYGALYAFVRRYGCKELCWFLDRYAFHRDVTTADWSDAGLAMLLRPADLEAEPPPELCRVKVFNEIGWAAMADHWPEPSLYVSLKTGDLSANHSHLDMNAVQVQADGEVLVTDLGNPPYNRRYFSPDRYSFYPVVAAGHNTLTVGGREQTLDGQGQIVEAEDDPAYRYLVASAGEALGEHVRFNRHVIMLLDEMGREGQCVVVLDEVTNAIPERIEASWHSFGQIYLEGQAGAIIGQQSGLHFRVAATETVACETKVQKLGQTLDCRLHVRCQPAARLVLVTVFSRGPVDRLEVHQSSRRDVTLRLPGREAHFKGSRRHLHLESIQRA